jgi:DNA-directed RNA polymerase specialized sigma24 family protein
MHSSFIHQYHDSLDRWIRKKARTLLYRSGFTHQDLEDVQQTLWLRVLSRLPSLPVSSPAEFPIPFLECILDQGLITLLRDRKAQKRFYSRQVLFNDLPPGFVDRVAERRDSDSLSREFQLDWQSLSLNLDPIEQKAIQFISGPHRYGLRKALGLTRTQFRHLMKGLKTRFLHLGFAPGGIAHE